MRFTLEVELPDGGKWFPTTIVPENAAKLLEDDLAYFFYDFMRHRVHVTVKKEAQSKGSH
ncbi:MAG TPA: hypothetical protein VMU04_24090 [Candidatus Acidoferrum sp.]|nr:hypothetical protein [Candidatus Acidoferrum sp.]